MDHIRTFPAEASHYSRNRNLSRKYLSHELNISKMYTLFVEKVNAEGGEGRCSERHYCDVFTTKFNLDFGLPRTDTCKTCDGGTLELI